MKKWEKVCLAGGTIRAKTQEPEKHRALATTGRPVTPERSMQPEWAGRRGHGGLAHSLESSGELGKDRKQGSDVVRAALPAAG